MNKTGNRQKATGNRNKNNEMVGALHAAPDSRRQMLLMIVGERHALPESYNEKTKLQ
jgi:hypothetical protein